MHIVLIFLGFTLFCEVVYCEIYPRQDQYLKKHKIKCGVLPEMQAGRIVNGEPTDYIHPWAARIVVTWNWGKEEEGVHLAAGSIITDKVVLTCGHCICNHKCQEDNVPVPVNNDPFSEVNLNEYEKRQIHVFLGQNSNNFPMEKLDSFEPDIRAYWYQFSKYSVPKIFEEEATWKSSANGDVGIIININGYPLSATLSVPICLPSADTHVSNEKVYTAGWGRQYHNIITGDPPVRRTSCQTNEGVTNITGEHTRAAFLPCIDQILSGQRFCELIPASHEKTVSTQAIVTFKGNKISITDPMGSQCEEYWESRKILPRMKKYIKSKLN